MHLGIEGKVAFITGAGRGLGKSIANCLAREGVSIIANSRSEEDLRSLMNELPKPKSEIDHQYFCADLATNHGPEDLLNFLDRQQVTPDIVIHNLGGNLNITDPLCSLDQWRSVMRINVEVPIELNRIFIPQMQKKGWGRICHVSSIAGLENQGPPAYCAAKAALIAYARSVGRYVAKDGIVVTSILPGAVFTEGGYWDTASKTRPGHVEKYLSERMAINRFGKPDEIGEVVTFMCSNHSSFCIGSAFLVDGGQGKVFFGQELS
ncbi:MAG: NAD(P)-dependent oxidoreductase [Chlamydiae bacterium CG10_big_fil_rev_8_21_14_0_10_42_34]|nr:MAG: NAD(P)-dependent oxidoreductase [Chlamydiae bacterium CG10_big_fil_rev_8_21_14_0_10_42_34]